MSKSSKGPRTPGDLLPAAFCTPKYCIFALSNNLNLSKCTCVSTLSCLVLKLWFLFGGQSEYFDFFLGNEHVFICSAGNPVFFRTLSDVSEIKSGYLFKSPPQKILLVEVKSLHHIFGVFQNKLAGWCFVSLYRNHGRSASLSSSKSARIIISCCTSVQKTGKSHSETLTCRGVFCYATCYVFECIF